MHKYLIGCYQKEQQIIEAEDSYSAKQKAIEIYKPTKKNMNLVWVELISKETSDVQFR